jgi:hypothetical protein
MNNFIITVVVVAVAFLSVVGASPPWKPAAPERMDMHAKIAQQLIEGIPLVVLETMVSEIDMTSRMDCDQAAALKLYDEGFQALETLRSTGDTAAHRCGMSVFWFDFEREFFREPTKKKEVQMAAVHYHATSTKALKAVVVKHLKMIERCITPLSAAVAHVQAVTTVIKAARMDC